MCPVKRQLPASAPTKPRGRRRFPGAAPCAKRLVQPAGKPPRRDIGSPSLFPHQRSDRHRTSRASATSPPERFSCGGITPPGKRSRHGALGLQNCSQMPLRPISPGCSASRSAPVARNVDCGLNQTPLYSRIDTEGVIFYNWQVSTMDNEEGESSGQRDE